MKAICQPIKREGEIIAIMIFCPGCKYGHMFYLGKETGRPKWTWNGNLDKPSFYPSMLAWKDDPTKRCHSFVEDGNIRFLNDCFHELKNKTVALEPF